MAISKKLEAEIAEMLNSPDFEPEDKAKWEWWFKRTFDDVETVKLAARLRDIVKKLASPDVRAWTARVKEKEAKEAAELAERDRATEARLQQENERWLDAEKHAALIPYKAAGGTEEEFEAAWPARRAALIEEKAAKIAREAFRPRF